jgi:hypothetical protein
VDVIEQHEIAEADHRILNPFTDGKLMLLGGVCRLGRTQRQLDLACGKGEMLMARRAPSALPRTAVAHCLGRAAQNLTSVKWMEPKGRP